MPEPGIDLPAGWSTVSGDYQRESHVAAYQRRPTEATTFLVSVTDEAASPDRYEVRLSTISISSKYVRHDYPVDSSRTRDAAFDAAEAFIEHVHDSLEEGAISAVDPGVDETRAVIAEFTGNPLFPRVQRLYRRFRS